MSRHHYQDASTSERALNAALIQADISQGWEAYLAICDRFYAEDVEVASDSHPETLVGKARLRSVVGNLLVPLHVMAELGGLSVSLKYVPIPNDQMEELHSEWTLDLIGTAGRRVILTWSSARRWENGQVIYERRYGQNHMGEPLTALDLDSSRPWDTSHTGRMFPS
jgi:hypothetical protein